MRANRQTPSVFLPDNGSGHPTFDSAGHRMEVQNSITVRLRGTQGESYDAVHEIERVPVDVECTVVRIRIEQLVVDLPGMGIFMIVDDQRESGHVGDVDERLAAFVAVSAVANVDHGRDEQRIILKLLFGELVLTQDLVCSQGEREQLWTADLPVAEFASVQHPQSVARVHLRSYFFCV